MNKTYGPKGMVIRDATLIDKGSGKYEGFGEGEFKGKTFSFVVNLTMVEGGYRWNSSPADASNFQGKDLLELFKIMKDQ